MTVINDFFDACCAWFYANWQRLVFSIVGIVVVYFVYRLLNKEITKLKERKKLEENIAFNLNRILKWVFGLIAVGIVVAQFGFDVGLIAGFMALAGGTILGFASMNTIGNAIAGVIVMISKPFKIGDRILFNKQFADIIAVDLIYTRMRTLDNVMISVPNQQLLTSEIDNYGRKNTVRRNCSVTVGYELLSEKVEKALLEAASKVEGVLKEPKPYVWITNFHNFSVEYTLYVFISQIKMLPIIDSDLKRTVLDICRQNEIDLVTPSLIQSFDGKNNSAYPE
ncbi:MAG: mechanosensitive ion channel family protein [Candidatus Bathyarchaeota archaeon]|nr:mechanosensitive ion channel family protein [Candidatus Bathyarchaeota archaeon]